LKIKINILISGDVGFIGRHLIKELLKNSNNNIICIDNLITGSLNNIKEFENNKNFKFINHNIIDKINIKEKIDYIYHLASIASPDKYKKYSIETIEVNTIGTKNMLELAKKNNSKILFTSTSEVYGDPLVHPQTEEYYGNVNTVGERSCYDESKRLGETYCYEYFKKYNVDIKIVRLFNTYGPYMDKNDGRVISNFIYNTIENKDCIIYGDGNQTRSFCYIDDLVEGLIKMMYSKEHGPINLGNPYNEFTINYLIEILNKITNKKINVIYKEKTENDPKIRKPNITKAKKLLNWNPKINLETGLINYLNYLNNN
jgi:UDP-glucuronate decarboxylase